MRRIELRAVKRQSAPLQRCRQNVGIVPARRQSESINPTSKHKGLLQLTFKLSCCEHMSNHFRAYPRLPSGADIAQVRKEENPWTL